ncbi:hypothetical protein [Microbulbifer donghaiensis]|uniref:hypothetical protein n=1 Tax=Microbulbifer donghaiensis TaxID=494016 RepID=UPI001160F820|nr:hypothetical protein [Microbulbifer donghaiensis]
MDPVQSYSPRLYQGRRSGYAESQPMVAAAQEGDRVVTHALYLAQLGCQKSVNKAAITSGFLLLVFFLLPDVKGDLWGLSAISAIQEGYLALWGTIARYKA